MDEIGKPENFEEVHFFPVSAPDYHKHKRLYSLKPKEYLNLCFLENDYPEQFSWERSDNFEFLSTHFGYF